MTPIIYRNTSSTPWVDIPNLDLLTLLFDSPHAPFDDSTLLHQDAASPRTNQLTKGALRTLTQRIAHGLRTQHGVGARGPGRDVVTVITHGQILVPALFYGIVAAGGVYSAASPHSTAAELGRQVTLGHSRVIVCSVEFEALAVRVARECGLEEGCVLVLDSTEGAWRLAGVNGGASCISARMLGWERITDPEALRKSLIVILWSSGTTGLPKGVMLSHANLVAETYLTALASREWGAKQVEMGRELPPYRTLAHLPVSHIAGLFGYFIGPMYSGGLVVWMRKYEWTEFYRNVSKFGITALYTVPSIFLRISKSQEVKDHFRTVENATTGAAPMDEVLQRAANERLGRRVGGQGKDETYIGQTWGLSETTGAVSAVPKGEVDESGCIGFVLPNVEIRQVMHMGCRGVLMLTRNRQIDENLQDVKPGEPGHMVVRSVLVTNGYFDNQQATDEAFVQLPDDDGGKWFCTGDIAVLRNGKFYIVDRMKELLKYKGQQVAPAEIENILAAHDKVAEAAVVGVPGTGEGEVGSDLPRAYVVRKDQSLTEDEVKEWVKSQLAHYKQLRGGVAFIDEIPKNAIGKYLRRELRERAKKEIADSGKAKL